jgi:hypothetical protein
VREAGVGGGDVGVDAEVGQDLGVDVVELLERWGALQTVAAGVVVAPI